MTDRDYVGAGGGCCPYCRSDSIDGGSTDFSGSQMSQEVSCNDCHADWMDVYDLSGWEPGRSTGDSVVSPGHDEPDQ